MLYQLSSYIKKHLLMGIRQQFLPGTLVKFNGIICIQFASLQNKYISEKNDCNDTFRLPDLMNDILNKTYRSTESKEVKKLWSKLMSSSELRFLSIPLFWGTLYSAFLDLF